MHHVLGCVQCGAQKSWITRRHRGTSPTPTPSSTPPHTATCTPLGCMPRAGHASAALRPDQPCLSMQACGPTNHASCRTCKCCAMARPTMPQHAGVWPDQPCLVQDMQVLRYGPTNQYKPHIDGLGRVATVLIYLVPPEEGGETVGAARASTMCVCVCVCARARSAWALVGGAPASAGGAHAPLCPLPEAVGGALPGLLVGCVHSAAPAPDCPAHCTTLCRAC